MRPKVSQFTIWVTLGRMGVNSFSQRLFWKVRHTYSRQVPIQYILWQQTYLWMTFCRGTMYCALIPTFSLPLHLWFCPSSSFHYSVSPCTWLPGREGWRASLTLCACVHAYTHAFKDRGLYHVCTMTHFFHWDGIYITHQIQVKERHRSWKGGAGRGERRDRGFQRGKEDKREICEFNYASIVFTEQRCFGNICGPYVEPAAS